MAAKGGASEPTDTLPPGSAGGAVAVRGTLASTICRIADPTQVARPRQLRDASTVMRLQPAHQSMINRRHDDRASCPARRSLKHALEIKPPIHAPATCKGGHKSGHVRNGLARLIDSPPMVTPANHSNGLSAQSPILSESPRYRPMSSGQLRVWFVEQLAERIAVNNLSFGLRLTGELNTAALDLSFRVVVDRHETLRTTFHVIDGEPRQLIHHAHPSVQVIDLSGFSGPELEREAYALASHGVYTPFDLVKGPLEFGCFCCACGPTVTSCLASCITLFATTGRSDSSFASSRHAIGPSIMG
jgi:Condensation domain